MATAREENGEFCDDDCWRTDLTG